MRLSFDSIDEVKEFVKGLKGTRGGKNDADEGADTGKAPTPIMPNTTGQVSGFPGNQAAGAGAFPGGAPAGPDPTALATAQRIAVKLDASIAAGNSAQAALDWFKTKFGPEAAQYTLDHVKANLVRLPVPVLDDIAKMMGA